MKTFSAIVWRSCARRCVVVAIGFSVLAAPSLATEPNKMRHPANPEGGAPNVGTPTVSPSITDEGSSTSFSVSGDFTDSGGGSDKPFTAVVDWGDGSNSDAATVSGSDNPFSYSFNGVHTYAQDGSYSVTVTITDNNGQAGLSDSTTVSVNNVAPTVDTPIVAPATVNEGSSTFSVSGGFSDPGGAADQPYSATIDWGDGNTDAAMVSGSDNPFTYAFNGNHTYSQDGTYFVTVSVTDQNGTTGFSSATIVSVENVAPTAGTPQVSPSQVNEGTETSFSVTGTFSDPGGASDQPYTVQVDWGDGSSDIGSVSGSDNPFNYSFNGNHTYIQDGSYFLTVSVLDQNGSTGTSNSATVTVSNVTPVVETPQVSPSTTESTPTFFSVSGTFSDPGGNSDEPYIAVIDWGDGATDNAMVSGNETPFTYSFNGTHTYGQSGSYSVTVSVTDQNGSTGTSNTALATVDNVPPTVDTPAVSPAKTTEGTETGFSVSGTFSDPAGALDQPYTAVVDWGDGTPIETASVDVNSFTYSFNGNHTYAQEGTYNVTVSITDNDNGTGVSNATAVTVSHVMPIVTNTSDSGDGSLRKALADANDGDTITFSIPPIAPNVSATINVITLTTGELVVNKSVTIMGLGANVLEVTRDPNAANFRIFHIVPFKTVTIQGMTISNGVSAGYGGGIYNSTSALTVNSCVLSGNASFYGAGIFNDANTSGGPSGVTVMNSTFSGNVCGEEGGAISNLGDGSGNAVVTVNNSTFSQNSNLNTAGGSGGAIHNYGGVLTIANSTFTKNSAPNGSCIFNFGTLDIGNTILESCASGANIVHAGLGVATSHGYNLSGDNGGGFLTAPGDQINTDPMLGPLKDNGGPTLTHAPLINSPTVDQGKRDTIPTLSTNFDQRGFGRQVNDPAVANAVSGDGSDIGAVELAEFVHPTDAASRKTHGAAGDFDIDLPLVNFANSPIGIECRSVGATGVYTVVVNFPGNVSFTDAQVTSCGTTATVSNATGSGTNQAAIDLTSVTNGQIITLALFDVDDGTHSADLGIRMRVLLGDTTGDGVVDASDVSAVKFQSGQPVTGSNFRADVTANGVITSTDVSLVKSKSGTLP